MFCLYLNARKLRDYLSRGMKSFGYNEDSLTDDSWEQLAKNMEPLIVDLLYAVVDPRIRLGGGSEHE